MRPAAHRPTRQLKLPGCRTRQVHDRGFEPHPMGVNEKARGSLREPGLLNEVAVRERLPTNSLSIILLI